MLGGDRRYVAIARPRLLIRCGLYLGLILLLAITLVTAHMAQAVDGVTEVVRRSHAERLGLAPPEPLPAAVDLLDDAVFAAALASAPQRRAELHRLRAQIRAEHADWAGVLVDCAALRQWVITEMEIGHEVALLEARSYLALGRPRSAMAVLETMVASGPAAAEHAVLLGRAHLALRR
jgi:hypothetical protein